MHELIDFVSYLIHLYQLVLIVAVVMSWLFASGKISRYDPRLRAFMQGLDAVTQPLLKPIGKLIPNMGGLDLAPMILWLACEFIQRVVLVNLQKAF